jgi:hypothetical protein
VCVWTQLDKYEDAPPQLSIVVDDDVYRMGTFAIPKRDGHYEPQALTVSVVDGIRYEEVVRAMDAAQSAGLHDLWINSM